MLRFSTRAVQSSDAAAFESYAYPPPYDLYNSASGSAGTFLEPSNCYISVTDEQDDLWGFGCVGAQARVRGGRYSAEASILDVGVGMSPARVGQGYGRAFCAAIVAHASKKGARSLQVAVASFNVPSLRVWHALGFLETRRFNRPVSDDSFIQLISPAV